jgi:aminomethyltransferase
MPLRTPLYDSHLAAGAKMVDFSGWEMPINYGSQIEEHHAVRRDAGMFDVSHMCALDLVGADATRWLRRLLANDVAKLTTPGKALYSCLLDESAGVIDDLIVYFFTATHYRIVVNAGTATRTSPGCAGSSRRLYRRTDAAPRRAGCLAMIAVQGPNAREKFWAAFPATRTATEPLALPGRRVGGWLVARTGYTGEDGFEISLPAAGARASAWQKLLEPPGSSPAASAHATRCASKPA